jgi:DNA-binding Lrp family transcriptional regulator
MKAYVLTRIRTGELPEAVKQLRQIKGVVEASPTFGPYDAVVVVQAADLAALSHVVAWDIQAVTGVTETLTCLEMEGT